MRPHSRARGALLLLALSTHAAAEAPPPAVPPGADAVPVSVGAASAPAVSRLPGREEPSPREVLPQEPPASGDTALPEVLVPLPEPLPSPASPERRDPTGALTVVDVEARRGEARDTASLLAEVPGLLVQQLGGFGQLQSLSLRGASSTGVLVLLDGVPLNGGGGAVDLSRLPAASIRRLEVLRGGAGARYGSGALGGVVNIVSSEPAAAPRAELQATYGSFATALLQGSLTGPLLGGEALLLLHGARSAGDFSYLFDPTPQLAGDAEERRVRTNNDAALGGALLRFRRPLGEGLALDALGELTVDEKGLAGTPVNPTPHDRMANRRLTLSGRVTRQWAGGEVAVRAFVRSDALRLRTASAEQGLHALAGVDVDASALLAEAHGLSAQLSLHRESYVNAQAEEAWLRAALSLMDEWLLLDGRLSLVPAVRVERAGPFTLLSPKLGLSWELPWGLRLTANGGQSHRAPSFLELRVPQGGVLPNPELVPERALSADVGLAHATEGTRVSATAFYALYENLIAYEYYAPLLPRPYNFPAADVGGLEVAARVARGEWLVASAAWTLLFSRNLRDDPRYYLKELPYRPRHRGHVRVEVGPTLLRARAQVEAQSAQYTNRVQSRVLPARALLHLGLSSVLPTRPQLGVSLELRNALDTQAEDFNGFPLPGRAAFLTLTATLDPEASPVGRGAQEL